MPGASRATRPFSFPDCLPPHDHPTARAWLHLRHDPSRRLRGQCPATDRARAGPGPGRGRAEAGAGDRCLHRLWPRGAHRRGLRRRRRHAGRVLRARRKRHQDRHARLVQHGRLRAPRHGRGPLCEEHQRRRLLRCGEAADDRDPPPGPGPGRPRGLQPRGAAAHPSEDRPGLQLHPQAHRPGGEPARHRHRQRHGQGDRARAGDAGGDRQHGGRDGRRGLAAVDRRAARGRRAGRGREDHGLHLPRREDHAGHLLERLDRRGQEGPRPHRARDPRQARGPWRRRCARGGAQGGGHAGQLGDPDDAAVPLAAVQGDEGRGHARGLHRAGRRPVPRGPLRQRAAARRGRPAARRPQGARTRGAGACSNSGRRSRARTCRR